MGTHAVLWTVWIIAVVMWLVNQFYYQNQRRELAYRKARHASKAKGA